MIDSIPSNEYVGFLIHKPALQKMKVDTVTAVFLGIYIGIFNGAIYCIFNEFNKKIKEQIPPVHLWSAIVTLETAILVTAIAVSNMQGIYIVK